MNPHDGPPPTLDTLFEYAAFGPWVRQLLLVPESPFELPQTPLGDELDQIVAHRLAARALLLAKQEKLDVPEADAKRLHGAEFAHSRQSMHARFAGARACAELSNGGLRVLVVKGPAIAESYANPRLRAYSDLDLLVAPGDFRRSLHLLRAAGWRVKETYPRRYFPRWCVEGVNLERSDDERVDLHHHVPPWVWGRGLMFDGMWRRSRALQLAGETVRCASPEDNLLIAALHTVSDRSRPGKTPVIWRDLIELGRAVDIDRALSLARSSGLSGWLGQLLTGLPAGVVPAALTTGTADETPTRPRRLAAMMDVAHTGRRPSREWAARLPASSRLAYAAAVTVPDRAFLRATQNRDSYRFYWRTLLRPRA